MVDDWERKPNKTNLPGEWVERKQSGREFLFNGWVCGALGERSGSRTISRRAGEGLHLFSEILAN